MYATILDLEIIWVLLSKLHCLAWRVIISKIIYVVFKDRKAEIFTDSGRRSS